MIFKLFTRIKEIRKNKKTILEKIKTTAHYFQEGFYMIDCSSKIIYKVGYKREYEFERNHTLSGIKAKRNRHRFFYSIINKRVAYISGRRNSNGFTIGILSYDHCIFINPKQKAVLTYYNNAEKRNERFNKRQLLQKERFNLPSVLNDSLYKEQLLEEYIKKKEYNPERGLQKLLFFYTNKNIGVSAYANKNCLNGLISYLKKDLGAKIKNIISGDHLKQIITHGDCNYLNYIFDGDSFFFIDYDRAGMHFFFCDCIFFIFWQYYVLNDTSLIFNYFNGKYDSLFKTLFNSFDARFIPDCKYIYIYITIYDVSNFKINSEMLNAFERSIKHYEQK